LTADTAAVGATDMRSFAATLAPLVSDACDGSLGPITWFKADWQRGGAATGTAEFRIDGDDVGRPVVLKLPVGRRELFWVRALQGEPVDDPDAAVIPHLFASGEMLGGYDLAWIVIEEFEHGPLGLHWHDEHIVRIAAAAAKFQALASAVPVNEPPRREDWDELVPESIESVRRNALPDQARWKELLKKRLRPRLDELVSEWRARPVDGWVHGDLHLANAMSRAGLKAGPVSLIDFAEVHPGHWIEDAVYLERQLWARPERVKACRPVKAIADARRALDLPVEAAYSRLAMIRRALLAATAPRFLKSEGHPRHLAACLDWLERALHELK
jgi:hypothetical protein